MGSPENEIGNQDQGRPFSLPHVLAALGFILIYAILVATGLFPPLRSIIGVFALLAIGYSTLALIAGDALEITLGETIAFTVGLTIVVAATSALLVSALGTPITEYAILLLGTPVALLAVLRAAVRKSFRSSLLRHLRKLLDFSEYRPAEKVVAWALFGAIIVVLAIFISLAGLRVPDEQSPALAILGPDGTPASLPRLFDQGQPREIVITVLGGSGNEDFELRVRLTLPELSTEDIVLIAFHQVTWTNPLTLNASAEARKDIQVAAGGTWKESISLVIDDQGSFDLRFDLLTSSNTVVVSNRLPISVGG